MHLKPNQLQCVDSFRPYSCSINFYKAAEPVEFLQLIFLSIIFFSFRKLKITTTLQLNGHKILSFLYLRHFEKLENLITVIKSIIALKIFVQKYCIHIISNTYIKRVSTRFRNLKLPIYFLFSFRQFFSLYATPHKKKEIIFNEKSVLHRCTVITILGYLNAIFIR